MEKLTIVYNWMCSPLDLFPVSFPCIKYTLYVFSCNLLSNIWQCIYLGQLSMLAPSERPHSFQQPSLNASSYLISSSSSVFSCVSRTPQPSLPALFHADIILLICCHTVLWKCSSLHLMSFLPYLLN